MHVVQPSLKRMGFKPKAYYLTAMHKCVSMGVRGYLEISDLKPRRWA